MNRMKFSKGMKQIIGFVGVCACLSVQADPLTVERQDELKKEGAELIAAFASELKTNLQGAIKAGGLVQGIELCSLKATDIALSHSSSNWTVSRTTLKPRNVDNLPSSDETLALLGFERQLSQGVPIQDMLYTRQQEDGSFLVMKAIPTQALCLACHGESISEEVQTVLREKYPQDKATGYKEGQIRGAFSLTYRP